MDKKELTPEEIYKRNQRKSKILRTLAPIVFWGCLALSVLCLIFAIKNSFGNIGEICSLLDNKKFTGEDLRNNYEYLTNKYGEWVIGTGGAGFTITFINIGRALFSGLMVANCFLSVLFLLSAYLLGKWLFPKLSEQILLDNQDMVNMTVLKSQENSKK
jgi:hypothetical protein